MIETHEEHIDKVNKEINKQSEISDKFSERCINMH